ncbi:MAG: ABC-type transport auxiliary lipoprotein family protein [Nitrospinota bacterium]
MAQMRRAPLAAALLFLLSGCLRGNFPETKYYVIDYSLPPLSDRAGSLPATLGVELFRADSVYRQNRIVYRQVPHRVEFYTYRRWGVRPEEMITDKVMDHFSSSGLFRAVQRYPYDGPATYILRGRVKRFEEIDREDGWFARFALEARLIKRDNLEVILATRKDLTLKAEARTPDAFVKAMAEAMRKTLGELVGEAARRLRGK